MTISELYMLTTNHLQMEQQLVDVYTAQGDIAALTACRQDIADTQITLAQLQPLLPSTPPVDTGE